MRRFLEIGLLGAAAFALVHCGTQSGDSGPITPGIGGASGTGQFTVATSAGVGGGPMGAAPASNPTNDVGCNQPGERVYAFGLTGTRDYGSAPYVRAVAALSGQPNPAKSGAWPDPSNVHETDFINYYYQPKTSAPAPGTLGVTPYLAAVANQSMKVLDLQVDVTTSTEAAHDSRVSVVVDASPTMKGAPIARAVRVLDAIKTHLASTKSRIRVYSTNPSVMPFDYPSAVDVHTLLETSDGGALSGAIEAAYSDALADPNGPAPIVVVVSDGGASVGSIPQVLSENADKVSFVSAGVAYPTVHHETYLRQAAAYARGTYVYLDTDAEADRMFDVRFEEVTSVAARDVTLEIKMPGNYYVTDIDPGASTVDEASVVGSDAGAGQTIVFRHMVEVCDPTMILPTDSLTMTIKYKPPGQAEIARTVVSTIKDLLLLVKGTEQLDDVAFLTEFGAAVKAVDPARLAALEARYTLLSPPAFQALKPQIDELLAIH